MSQDFTQGKNKRINNSDGGRAQQKQEKQQHGQRFETLSG